MSTRTDNYNLIICDGSDVVNPLTQIFPNFTSLDDILRNIANTGITTATELLTGTVHALTRSDANVSVFRFQATSNFTGGETFTVDGAQVTALDVAGETLKTGAYIIGSMVLCELRDTLLTFYVSGGSDADTLEGHPASYFATNAALDTVDDKADANKDLIDGLTDDVGECLKVISTPLNGWGIVPANGTLIVPKAIPQLANKTIVFAVAVTAGNIYCKTFYYDSQITGYDYELVNNSGTAYTLSSSDVLMVVYKG